MSARLELLTNAERALEQARADVATLDEVVRLLRDGEVRPEESLRGGAGRKAGGATKETSLVSSKVLVEWIEAHIRSKPSGRSRSDYMLNGARESVDPNLSRMDIDAALEDQRFQHEGRGWMRMRTP